MCRTQAVAFVLLATVVTLTMVSGCSSRVIEVAPYIPPAYYDCIEVNPFLLYDAYYMKNSISFIRSMAEAQYFYDGKVFVFKNIEVTAPLFKYLDEDYFWVKEVIKCYCLNARSLKSYKIGDMIDVVGKNQGVVSGVPGLVFRDCIILPVGYTQLPAPGSAEGMRIPGY